VAIETHTEAGGKILVVRVSDKLTKEDYQHFVPEVERLIGQHGSIRILFDMHDFHGWTAGAMWQDAKFAWRHFRDVERITVVGEKAWQHAMTVFCRPFTKAQVRYFGRGSTEQAESWLQADLPVATAPGAGGSDLRA
jgi:hypothetical protein